VLLFMSRFEAWGMPVMEAMASGIAVVCSYSYGVQHFATDQENCLMVPSRDVPVSACRNPSTAPYPPITLSVGTYYVSLAHH